MTTAGELIIFGGTFDPPHGGHVGMVSLAAQGFPAAEIRVMPAAAPPLSATEEKAAATSFAIRVKMCQAAFSNLGARVKVSELEADLPKPSYTVATLVEILRREPGKKLALMIGEDQLRGFAKWKEPREILKLAQLLVVGRNRPNESRVALAWWIGNTAKELQLDATTDRIVQIPGEVSDASSTELRRLIATREVLPENWLPPAVAAIVKKEKLYLSV